MASQFATRCHKLIKSSISLLQKLNPSLPLHTQLNNHPILQDVKIPFQFDQDIGRRIGAMNIFSHPNLRISIFHIPYGSTMKLHDHPHMNVITCILQGSMEAKLFNQHPHKQGRYIKQTKILNKGDISITQPRKDNYHEFSGKNEKCSFLDILFPDYNQTDRICSYYSHEPAEIIQGKQTYKLTKLAHDYHDDMCQI